MAKQKYLSLEKAAQKIGVSGEELTRLRDNGDLRGFADRGSWKFKTEDLEEFVRSRQADSDPDVQIYDDNALDDSGDDSEGTSVLVARDDVVDEHPTVIHEESSEGSKESSSDSDVRLILDDSLTGDDSGSDSDVQLVDESDPTGDSGSDSDVRLIGEEGDGGSSILPQSMDSVSDVTLSSDSGVSLEAPADSRITLEGADSGITLEGTDSGITLEGADSGITLEGAEDSGISLDGVADSGIALADEDSGLALAKDRGIEVQSPADSGIALDKVVSKSGETGQTIPEFDVRTDDLDDTQMEVPALDGSEGTDMSVGLFDDEDADGDEFGDGLEVSADVIGEDDELAELDVFDAADEDFDDSFAAGESHPSFVAPALAGRVAAPVEINWGGGTFAGLLVSTLLMTFCGMMMFDLVRNIWGWQEPAVFNRALLEFFRSNF